MYAALETQLDINYAVNLLSRYNFDPRIRHLTTANRILKYLGKAEDLKLVDTKHSKDNLHGYSRGRKKENKDGGGSGPSPDG